MKKIYWQLPFLVLLIVGTILIVRGQNSTPYQYDQGMIFGTVYNVKYQYDQDLKEEIEKELAKVDASLSPFNKNSVITHINENTDMKADEMFMDVFALAETISRDTNGDFDITVAPLVNAWGFGFKNGIEPTEHVIDSLREIVGYEKVRLQNGMVVKKDPRVQLDCSAIAKGYAVDRVAAVLQRHGIENYLVEIGGEIVTKGFNPDRLPWHISVNKPIDDATNMKNETQVILNVTDKAMATSGNYRNFYYKDGKKYAHTINPKSGRPIQHNILSATVLTDCCAVADAYATAFMVMGLKDAQQVLKNHPELMAYIIYSDSEGKNAVWHSSKLNLEN